MVLWVLEMEAREYSWLDTWCNCLSSSARQTREPMVIFLTAFAPCAPSLSRCHAWISSPPCCFNRKFSRRYPRLRCECAGLPVARLCMQPNVVILGSSVPL